MIFFYQVCQLSGAGCLVLWEPSVVQYTLFINDPQNPSMLSTFLPQESRASVNGYLKYGAFSSVSQLFMVYGGYLFILFYFFQFSEKNETKSSELN